MHATALVNSTVRIACAFVEWDEDAAAFVPVDVAGADTLTVTLEDPAGEEKGPFDLTVDDDVEDGSAAFYDTVASAAWPGDEEAAEPDLHRAGTWAARALAAYADGRRYPALPAEFPVAG